MRDVPDSEPRLNFILLWPGAKAHEDAVIRRLGLRIHSQVIVDDSDAFAEMTKSGEVAWDLLLVDGDQMADPRTRACVGTFIDANPRVLVCFLGTPPTGTFTSLNYLPVTLARPDGRSELLDIIAHAFERVSALRRQADHRS